MDNPAGRAVAPIHIEPEVPHLLAELLLVLVHLTLQVELRVGHGDPLNDVWPRLLGRPGIAHQDVRGELGFHVSPGEQSQGAHYFHPATVVAVSRAYSLT